MRGLLKGFLVNTVHFLILFNVLAAAYQAAFGYFNPLLYFMAIPFFGMYAARLRVKNFWLFIAVHFACVALAIIVFIGNPPLVVMMTAFVIVISVYSVATMFSGERRLDKIVIPWMIGINMALYVISEHQDMGGVHLRILLNYSSLIQLVAVLIWTHMDGADKGIRTLINRHRRPLNDVISRSNIGMIIFAAVLVFMGLVSLVVPGGVLLSRLAALIWEGLRDFFRFLFSLMPDPGEYQEIELPPLLFEEQPAYDEPIAPYEMPRGRFMGVLVQITYVIIAVLIVGAVIFALAKTLKEARKRFNKLKMSDDNDTKSSLLPDEASKLRYVLADLLRLLPVFKSKAKHSIRRAFIKKVNAHIKMGTEILPSDTPDKIAEKIRTNENIDELTQAYEKVRYDL